MKNVGLLMMIIGIVIFIASILTGISINPINLKHVMYLEWFMGLGQILVISGIGFILYDIAEKYSTSKSPKVKEKRIEEHMEAKEAVMDCPNCNQKTKFPYSMIGSIVECPNCKTKVNIEGVQVKTENDKEFKWE